jgi:hypothetical protein
VACFGKCRAELTPIGALWLFGSLALWLFGKMLIFMVWMR